MMTNPDARDDAAGVDDVDDKSKSTPSKRGSGKTRFSGDLAVTGNPAADDLVNNNPVALLIALVLDQQISLELAFLGPQRLHERLGHLDPASIGSMSIDAFTEVVATKPALHRFPAATARRLHTLMSFLDEHVDGDPTLLWADVANGHELARRLLQLPGFGPEKTQITIAVLAKRFGITPHDWEDAAGVFADAQPRSAADAGDAASMAQVRAWKAAQKAAGLDKQGRRLKTQ